MKKLRALLLITSILGCTYGFSQELSPNKIKCLLGIDYTPAISLKSGLVHHYVGIQEPIIFKNQKMYANLSQGIKFYKQEKSRTKNVMELAFDFGVKLKKIKNWNVYGFGGGGIGGTSADDFFAAHWKVGARGILFNVAEDVHLDVRLQYMRYYTGNGTDNQYSSTDNQLGIGVGVFLFDWLDLLLSR